MFPLETEQAKRARYGKIAAVALPLLCLALPSLWLLTTVPPLWRDVDAYVQLTSRPNESTILLHGPLYCEMARLPLWFGHRATGGSMHLAAFLKQPRLTDAGVSILLFLQHAGFWLAAFYLIAALSTSLVVRIVLALFIASHSIFYAFAHCVGSETLSMILILLLAGVGLRIVAAFPAVPWHCWLLAGLVLFCAILTRHINAVLVGLFPLTIFLLLIVQEGFFSRERKAKTPGARHRPQYLRVLGVSLVVGLSAFFLASGYIHLLCRKVHIRGRLEFGFTFQWRLNFLTTLPPPARARLFEQIEKGITLPEGHRLLRLLQEWTDHHEIWDPVPFIASARSSFSAKTSKASHEQFDRALNDVASAFLSPPVRPVVVAARDDLVRSTRSTESGIVRFLFATTSYVDRHRAELPQAAALLTFRRPPMAVMQYNGAPYFRLWAFLSFRAWCALWSGMFLLLWLRRKRAAQPGSRALCYAVALSAVGVLMTWLNCFFARLQPRFALPMFELLLISLAILLGALLAHFPTNQTAASPSR